MSIPAEPSLFQYEGQVFDSEPCKYRSSMDLMVAVSCLKFKVFNIPSVAQTCSIVPQQDVSYSASSMGYKT